MTPTLDESQQRVTNAPTSERRIVIAGPGAGKTTTSIALISEIGRRDESVDRTVLFVSFSRAALKAAFTAFGSALDDTSVDVMAMTLDSFAWQLTDQSSAKTESGLDFDGVVNRARAYLTDDYDGELDEIIHLIVDEAQDMSSVRRELLGAIVDRLPSDAGMTVFGDPMQSIYDFLDTEGTSDTHSAWDHLMSDLAARSITKMYSLDSDHRARRRPVKRIGQSAPSLRTLGPANRVIALYDLLTDISHLSLDDFAERSSEWRGSIAVLARTNAEVTVLFEELVRRGHTCSWQEPGASRAQVAPWVAELWDHVGGGAVSVADFRSFASARSDVDDSCFRSMLDTAEIRGRIDWSSFARSLHNSASPTAPWFARAAATMCVSTIHQAKGLEWDNVAVVGAEDLLAKLDEREPEPELLFVGLSRARDRIVIVDWKGPYSKQAPVGGLIFAPWSGGQRPHTVRIAPEDLRSDRATGGVGALHVLSSCPRNSAVEFDLLSSSSAEWPIYRCRIGSSAVGVTTDLFGQSLAPLVKRRGSWPDLGPVPIDGVETRWSTVDQVSFWLKPRPFGMSTITYQKGD